MGLVTTLCYIIEVEVSGKGVEKGSPGWSRKGVEEGAPGEPPGSLRGARRGAKFMNYGNSTCAIVQLHRRAATAMSQCASTAKIRMAYGGTGAGCARPLGALGGPILGFWGFAR